MELEVICTYMDEGTEIAVVRDNEATYQVLAAYLPDYDPGCSADEFDAWCRAANAEAVDWNLVDPAIKAEYGPKVTNRRNQ